MIWGQGVECCVKIVGLAQEVYTQNEDELKNYFIVIILTAESQRADLTGNFTNF